MKCFNKEVVSNVSNVIDKWSKMNTEDYTRGNGGLGWPWCAECPCRGGTMENPTGVSLGESGRRSD